jgi:hypothetical protein
VKKPSGSVRKLDGLAEERHYSPRELSELWGFAQCVIRELFADEPGVIRLGAPSRRVGRTLTRSYYSLRIPASVVQRVHAKLIATKPRRA